MQSKFDYRRFLPPTLRNNSFRCHPLEGKLLLFDRLSGINVLLESVYDTNRPTETISLLADNYARFGVNWLISPDQIPILEERFNAMYTAGARDFLFLRYKGYESHLKETDSDIHKLKTFLCSIHSQYGNRVRLGVDVCWGQHVRDIPVLLKREDCSAGDDFLSITSDHKVKICSFQGTSDAISFVSITELKEIWRDLRLKRMGLSIGGCGRAEDLSDGLVILQE